MQSDYIHVVKNVFSEDLRESLILNCDNHFKDNLLYSDAIQITKCIIDCHGLALSTSSYFPYTERCWNIFCLKIKHHVLEYARMSGIDEFSIVPHSCWAERSRRIRQENKSTTFNEDFRLANDNWLKKHMLRSVYYLKNDDPQFGTDYRIDDKVKSIPGEQNSLVIFDGGSYPSSNKFSTNKVSIQYNIVFDWYINEPFDVPDWVLP